MPDTLNSFPEGVTLEPPGSNVLLRWLKGEKQSAGGIILTTAHPERQTHRHCIVEKIGPAVPDWAKEQLQVGDFVIVTYAGDEITVGNRSYVNVNPGNIQSIVRDLPEGAVEKMIADAERRAEAGQEMGASG